MILDSDLAALYGVPTKQLNEQYRRNQKRFPEDFAFQLTAEEADSLRSQTATAFPTKRSNRSQFATGSQKHRDPRYRPYAFTEHGILMLSSVLNSERAIQVNIEIMRSFVRLRVMLASNAELSRKLDHLESKYDRQFKVVFDAIRQLMSPPVHDRKQIGFR